MDVVLYNKMAGYCSLAEHCISEVQEKLKREKISQAECQEMIDRLIDDGFVDETRYARAFVRDKFRFNKWGRVKIRAGLYVKRISKQDIEQALQEIDEQKYIETLQELLLEKNKRIHKDTPMEQKAALMRFAASRGFEPPLILKYCQLDEE